MEYLKLGSRTQQNYVPPWKFYAVSAEDTWEQREANQGLPRMYRVERDNEGNISYKLLVRGNEFEKIAKWIGPLRSILSCPEARMRSNKEEVEQHLEHRVSTDSRKVSDTREHDTV